MELWIRSQDKNILEKITKLYVSTFDEEKGFGIYDLIDDDLDDCDIPLGFYETKERALEVLDHIQFLIERTGELNYDILDKVKNKLEGEVWGINSTSYIATYEMPQE